jgi:Immunity protein Imm1
VTSYDETAHRVLSEIRQHAANPNAERVRWWLDGPNNTVRDDVWGSLDGPSLSIGVGSGFGFAVWLDGQAAFITTGGLNTEPVRYEADEWADVYYPSGSEHPIDTIIDVVRRFADDGRRSDIVTWEPFDHSTQETIYKNQAADPSD